MERNTKEDVVLSEQAKRIQEYLASEYGITTGEELMNAVENDKGVNISLFVKSGEYGGDGFAKQI